MSNEKRAPSCLGSFSGDDALHSYMGITKNHEIRIPSLDNQDSMESKKVFFVAHILEDLTHKMGGVNPLKKRLVGL